MGTRLEGVQISVELDTSKAQRQIEQLDAQVARDSKKAKDINRTLNPGGSFGSTGAKNPATGTTGVSGGVQGTLARMIGRLPSVPQASTPISGTLSKAGGGGLGAAETVGAGLLSRGALGSMAGTAVAGAAAVYATTKAVGEGGSALAAAAQGAFPDLANHPAFKEVLHQVNQLRSFVNYLESTFSSFFTAAGKTGEMTAATARIHGTIPNLPRQFFAFSEADRLEKEMEKHFEDLKSDEIFRVLGSAVRGGIHR